jgi:hypothetical protein
MGMATGRPSTSLEMTELVVPRSIPNEVLMSTAYW